ncbi:hypothetical protein [Pedobacter alpinus]|uniref:Lipoprotein n=1 Tax=Pedobacter alpinus TaxID=1590643 RepID=A0ABW5TPN1_9SPHI
MKQVKLLMLCFVIIFIGCRPLKNLSPMTYSIEPIEKNEFAKLDGSYNDVQDTVFGEMEHFPKRGKDENSRRLLDRLFIFYPNNAYDKGTIVDIKFTSNRKATISAYQNGTVLFTKNIQGKS